MLSGSFDDNFVSLKQATWFGANDFFNVLIGNTSVWKIFFAKTEELLRNFIKSENAEMIRELLNHSTHVSRELVEEAEDQKNALILSLLSVSSVKLTEEAKKEKMKKDVENG